MNLLATYTHDSKVQLITAILLIYTLYKSLEHTLKLLSYFLVTDLNNGDSSASVLTSLPAG
jgi:hypothetical protein